MASSIETTSSTTILKNNGNTYLSVDTNDDVTVTNDLAVSGTTTLSTPLPVASGGTGKAVGLEIMIVQHQEAVGTNGGASLAGVNTRDLNTVQYNNLVGASLATKQVTLNAGTYHMKGRTSGYASNLHKSYIYDITNSALVIAGSSEHAWSSDATQTFSYVNGVLTTTGTTVFELRQYVQTAHSSGFGNASNYAAAGVEVYAELQITRMA